MVMQPCDPTGSATGLNYGLTSPLHRTGLAGARVRMRVPRAADAQAGDRVLLKLSCTLEIEGGAKPALVAELLCMLIGKREASA